MGRITNLGAVILCGGQSSRMGYPKALLPFGDKTLLTHMIDLLAQRVENITVVASPQQILPPLDPEIKVVYDQVAFQGPLSGMLTGFESTDQSEFLFVTATDTPLLQWQVVKHMYDRSVENHYDIVIPYNGQHHYPLTAIYHRETVLHKIKELLGSRRYRPVYLMEDLFHLKVLLDEFRSIDPDLASFRNLNSRADYRELLNTLNMEVPKEFDPPEIQVEFYGVTRLLIGSANTHVLADDTDALTDCLSLKFPSLIGTVIVDGKLHPAFRFVKNASEFLSEGRVGLKQGDSIMLIHADAGG